VIDKILKDTFGYDQFRPLQKEAIEAVLDKKDVLLVLPTGGGKSICFQVPALAQEGVSIVVSPLIALMNDQVIALQQNGIAAFALHSNLDFEQKKMISDQIEQRKVKLLYLSPEGLLEPSMLNYVKRLQPNLIAIDEAHCVSMWGNDFRPDYARLKVLKDEFPDTPLMAVTATADGATQKDIIKTLQMDAAFFLGSFERENITISAKPGQDRFGQIKRFLVKRVDDPGIIYCTSRKSTESVSAKLVKSGFRAAHYHAGLSSAERNQVHQDFLHDRVQIVCATIAFGMGIDKSNIRYVIHYNISKNIESYYQEIGRAGRDGSDADALLFYSYADITQLKKFIDESDAHQTFKNVQHAKLDRMWAFSNTSHCRTNIILNYFGEFKAQGCGHCDNCINPPEVFDGSKISQMALSAVYRVHQNINLIMLIDILRGSGKQEVMMNGFHQIKTYGAGRDIPFADWRSYITQMIQQGLLTIDYTDQSKIKLTPLSNAVLFENRKIDLVKFNWEDRKAKPAVKKLSELPLDVDEALYEKLKALRNKLSKEQNVPAYVIFPNKTLEHMSSEKPKTKLEFSMISGVGKMKLEKYAALFLKEINTE